MKKEKAVGRKLSLNKKMIARLAPEHQRPIAGGAVYSQVTAVPELCAGNTDQYGCTTHSWGIACTVLFCV